MLDEMLCSKQLLSEKKKTNKPQTNKTVSQATAESIYYSGNNNNIPDSLYSTNTQISGLRDLKFHPSLGRISGTFHAYKNVLATLIIYKVIRIVLLSKAKKYKP